jgi:hypothetical protein
MRIKSLLIIGTCLGLASCTPFEREVAEEVLHEASVAEQAVEADLKGTVYVPQYGPTAPTRTPAPAIDNRTGAAQTKMPSIRQVAEDASLVIIYASEKSQGRKKYWPRGFYI